MTLTLTTPKEALEMHLREQRTEVAQSTIDAHKYRLGHFVRWCNEEDIDNLNSLSGRDLHRYKLWRQEDGDLNRVSLKTQMDTLRVFMKFCESIDAVKPDIHDKVLSPSLSSNENQRDTMLDADEASRLLDYLGRFQYASFDHTLLILLWHSGMRTGSVRAVDLTDYSPENACIEVRHRPKTPLKNKDGGERLIALSTTVCEVIDDWIAHNRLDVTDEEGREPLFTTSHGRPHKTTIRDTVYRWTRPCQYLGDCPHDRNMGNCEALNRSRKTAYECPSSVAPHAIRRGSITHYLTEDVPETVVSDRMDVSQRVLDKHYDRRTEQVKMEQRREYLEEL